MVQHKIKIFKKKRFKGSNLELQGNDFIYRNVHFYLSLQPTVYNRLRPSNFTSLNSLLWTASEKYLFLLNGTFVKVTEMSNDLTLKQRIFFQCDLYNKMWSVPPIISHQTIVRTIIIPQKSSHNIITR